MKEIPLVDLKAGFTPIRDEIIKAIDDVLNGMNLYLGPNCQALEKEFATYCGTKYAIGVGSGTEAIQFALLASGIKRGDEIITSPNTFFATVEAIACIGAKPVFVDIDPATYNINPDEIGKRINRNTKAIIPVHMYGQSADMGPIMEISNKYGIPVIEDACQAHGAEYMFQNNPLLPSMPFNKVPPPNPPLVKGGWGDLSGRVGGLVSKKCGSMGNAGCFSFYFTKNLGAYGEGGMVITSDEKLSEEIRLYRNHGHKSKFEHVVVGYNGRLDEIQAAILRIKLKYLDEYNQKRRQRAAIYNSLLKDVPVILPTESHDRMHVYHLYVIRSKERDSLQEYLKNKEISTGIHYKNPVHLQEALSNLGYKRGDFPETEKACDEILSLPIYPELSEESQVYIAEKIKEFFFA